MTNIYMELPTLGGLVTGVYARGQSIPNDRDNPTWREYLAFLEAGGTAMPFDAALEWKNNQWVQNPEKQAAFLAELKLALCNQLDAAADAARLSVVGDPLRVVEYERAATEAKAFRAAAYSGDVPISVQTAADATGQTPQEAAEDILNMNALWNAALYRIRGLRLKGKEAIRNAESEADARQAVQDAERMIRTTLPGASAPTESLA